MIKSLVRYVYEYYRYGGLYPWIAAHISRCILPISVFWTIAIIAQHEIIIAVGIIITLVSISRMLWVIIKHTSGMLHAKKIYDDCNLPANLLTCTPWRDVASRLVDKGILDVDASFGGEVESLSRAFVDAAEYLPTSTTSLDVLRRSLHRSLRSAIPLRFSLFIEGCKETILWPILTLERLSDIIVNMLPLIYASPREIVAYTFVPTIPFTHRGVHEMHFEATTNFDRLTGDVNAFLAEFPSPLLDTVYRIARVPFIILAGYFLYHRLFEPLIICIVVFGVISNVSSPGRMDPTILFETVNARFRADDAVHLKNMLMERYMRRRVIQIIIDIAAIIFAPIMAWSMMSESSIIYDVCLRRISIIDGEVGLCMSTRVYRHVTMLEDTRGMTTSEMMMFDEFNGLMGRVEV